MPAGPGGGGVAGAEPGLAALIAGLEASGRWLLANPAIAQLMFWRPVPSFEPSPEAFAPAPRWPPCSAPPSPTRSPQGNSARA